MVPPTKSVRSCMPSSPKPSPCWPGIESRSVVGHLDGHEVVLSTISTVTCSADACLTVLLSASWTSR